MNSQLITGLMLALFLSGCSTYVSPPGSHPYGAAKADMTERQTAYPDRVVSDQMPVVDGTITENVIETYRRDTGKPQTIKNAIQVNIGK